MQILSRLRGLVAPTTGDQPLRLADGGGGGGGGSPLTTKGDLFGFDTGGNRVPVGANGKVLTADSTAALGVSYQSPVSGSVIVSDGSTTVPTAATLLFSGASVTNLGSGVAGVSVSGGGGGGAGLVYGQPDLIPAFPSPPRYLAAWSLPTARRYSLTCRSGSRQCATRATILRFGSPPTARAGPQSLPRRIPLTGSRIRTRSAL